jgi:hypothetical protein
MAKIAKNTDLTKLEGDPGSRADVAGLDEGLEDFQLRFRLAHAHGASGELIARAGSGSSLGTAVAVLLLTLSGCTAAIVVALIVKAPAWAACAALLVPPATYTAIRRTTTPRNPGPRHG